MPTASGGRPASPTLGEGIDIQQGKRDREGPGVIQATY